MSRCHVVSAENSGPHHLLSGLQTEEETPGHMVHCHGRGWVSVASWNAVSSKCCSHFIVQIKAGTKIKEFGIFRWQAS